MGLRRVSGSPRIARSTKRPSHALTVAAVRSERKGESSLIDPLKATADREQVHFALMAPNIPSVEASSPLAATPEEPVFLSAAHPLVVNTAFLNWQPATPAAGGAARVSQESLWQCGQ